MENIKKKVDYILKGIELMSFSIQERSKDFNENNPIKVNFKQEQKVNSSDQIIFKYSTIEILDTEDGEPLARLKIACSFALPGYYEIVNTNEKGEITIIHEINMALAKVCTGVARGILFTHLKGTYLQAAVLPLLPFE